MPRRYKNIDTTKSTEGVNYRTNAIYPEVPVNENDIYVITSAGDRFDVLAQQFYNDSSLWWIIASANNYFRGSLNITPGIQLRIPADKNQVLQNFDNVNNSR